MQVTQNEQNKLNPGSVASYDLRPGNGVGLLWQKRGRDGRKKKIDKANEKRKMGKVKKSKRWGGEWTRAGKRGKGAPASRGAREVI